MKSDQIDSFKGYSQFSSLKEFNIHVEKWLLDIKHEFTKAEIVGLKRLIRFSAKIPGVSNAKIATILKAIHNQYHDNGISRSTFKRMLAKAKQLGILTIYETERNNGSQSSNLYVFNRFPLNEQFKSENSNNQSSIINNRYEEPRKLPKETNSTENIKSICPQHDRLDYTYTSERVPKEFIGWVKIYYNDAKKIEAFWKMAMIAAYKNNYEKEADQILAFAIAAFKLLIRKLKTTRILRNPLAYFYGILMKKFKELYFENLYEMGFPIEKSENKNTFHSFRKWLESS